MTFIEELCIAGGAHRGISYIGVLRKLEELELLDRLKLKRVIGTSIGALVSYIYLLGLDPLDFFMCVIDKDISSFKNFNEQMNGYLINNNKIYEWIIELINVSQHTNENTNENTTFIEFYEMNKIDYNISAVCIETQNQCFFNYRDTPDVKIIDAVMASISLPLIFNSYKIGNKSYYDGGYVCNMPIYRLGPFSIGIMTIPTPISNNEGNEGIMNMFDSWIQNIETYIDIIHGYFEKLHNEGRNISEFIIKVKVKSEQLNFDMSEHDKINLFMMGYNEVIASDVVHKFKNMRYFQENVLREMKTRNKE